MATRPRRRQPAPRQQGIIPVGKIRGVKLQLHWSIFPAFGLFAYTLATGVFQDRLKPGDPDVAWIFGLGAAAIFMLSIVLHEFGHAVVAQRNSLRVDTITLFFFGGIAQVQDEPKSAGVEFRVAAGGPLVSLVLALGFGAATLALPNDGLLDAGAAWLTRTNLALLLFNLIPGYPLDGGRILRAAVWHVSKSERKATSIAVRGGQIFAAIIGGVGVLFMVIEGSIFAGLWLVLIAWFLQTAATASGRHIITRTVLEGITAAQAMAREIVYIPSRTRVLELVESQPTIAPGRAFIVADEGPLGVISPFQLVFVPRERWPWTVVTQIMTPWRSLATVSPDTNLFVALEQMDEAKAFFALVVDQSGGLAGVLSRDQILGKAQAART